MTIDLVFITFNRLEYTKLALASVLADPKENFSLTIWDNASTDGTVEYLKNNTSDTRIADIIFSQENIGQIEAVNRIWSKSKADLLGKLDNDCIVTPGWTRKLSEAHRDIYNLGVIACWHFAPEVFDYERARKKIQTFGKHQILRHPWTCGTGLLIKKDTYKKFGPLQGNRTTQYWINMALKGYINGFYYPLVYQEHMDYIWSKHYAFSDNLQEGMEMSVSASDWGIHTAEQAKTLHRQIVQDILDGPWDAKYYVGWRGKLRRGKRQIYRKLKFYI
jgi:glycosyltransferase involved in cell wall biosynthesis